MRPSRYDLIETGSAMPVDARIWNYADGERETQHSHAEAQLVYVTQGVLRVFTPTGILTVAPYQGVWLPPMLQHELQAVGEVKVRSAYLDRVYYEHTLRGWIACRVCTITPLLDALLGSIASVVPKDAEASMHRSLALDLFVLELARAKVIAAGVLPLPQDRRLRAICEQMLEAPENNDTIDRWGDRVGASVRTLTRLFREETGLSFSQWRAQLRLVEAIARLAVGTPVATIAGDLGYQSPSAFIAMFRKTLGDTPQRYLKRMGANN